MILCRNVPWMVFCKVFFLFADLKSKMATTPGHSLTLDPMGNMYKDLLLRNHGVSENDLLQKCSLDGPLQTLRFFFANPKWPPLQDIVQHWTLHDIV